MKFSEYLLANDDRSLPSALTEGEIINDIQIIESMLQVILDHVDYMSGACRVNESIGAVLPKQIIIKAKRVLHDYDKS